MRVTDLADLLKVPAFMLGAIGALGIVVFRPIRLAEHIPALRRRLPRSVEGPAKAIAVIEMATFVAWIVAAMVIWYLHRRRLIL